MLPSAKRRPMSPCPVQSRPVFRVEPVGNKRLSSQIRLIPVAASHTRSADVEFASKPAGTSLPSGSSR